MARQIGPDQAQRVWYYTSGAKKGKEILPAGTPVPLYADIQCSLPADVRALDGSVIPGDIPTVLIADTLEVPQFQFPDVEDPEVYTRLLGGPVITLRPSNDARIDDLRERVEDLEPGGGNAGVPATRTITTSNGLTGGGDLTANRTIQPTYGTTANTVAQGNDSRFTDSRTPTAHAASHGSAGSDPVALNGNQITTGTVATARLSVGTASGTVAAGDDSRITGAAQKASNLSDLANATTARTNLGLGSSATRAVGSGAGQVLSADTADAKGDLLAATAADTLARHAVGTDGQVLTANSAQATGLAWNTPVDIQGGTTSGTWTNPSPSVPKPVLIQGQCAGSGGGSGRRGAAGSLRTGGGGGASGIPFSAWALTTDFPATVPYTVGAGGTGAPAPTTDSTDGSDGLSGGNTFFGAALATYRIGGANSSSAAGGRGGTSSGAAAAGASSMAGPAGAASSATGGAGNSAAAATLANGAGLSVGTGGGAGGGVSTGNIPGAGGSGGPVLAGFVAGGTSGVAPGGNGGDGVTVGGSLTGGTGGGGGAGSDVGGGGRGGDGGFPGGGGGGAGAGLNGFTGQPGGLGGGGFIRITTFLF